MVRLRRVTGAIEAEIYVKLEYFNPSGSLKDRVLYKAVTEAERRGELKPGMRLIEGTTGNTGIATAMVGAALGYPVTIVMPRGMSEERKKTIRAYGAELVLTEGAESDVDLVIEKVKEIKSAHPGKYWEVGQFTNMDNVKAHYETTGPEIWEQTCGKVQALVAAAGTGGTVTGAGKFLKERDPSVRVFAVEPEECAILSGGGWGPHKIEGIGDGFIPPVLDLEVLDGVIQVSSDEAMEMARRMTREEGIFCGISSGCNVAAAIKLCQEFPDIKTVVTFVNDAGFKYLSTELWSAPTKLEVPQREHPLVGADARSSRQQDFVVIKRPLGSCRA
ncbi:MAG TPA: cysteine synthase A [Firmicutes bacterium]|nr:cysteine synthase A [Bacillota bacterium]